MKSLIYPLHCEEKLVKKVDTAILLAAGYGSRLNPITKSIPKTMIEIDGKPILEYIIEDCKKNGITNIGIVVSHLKKQITDYFGNGKKFGVKIKYFQQRHLSGTSDALFEARNFVKNKSFVVYLADTIIPKGLKEFLKCAKNENLIMVSKLSKNEAKISGIVKLNKNKIISLEEKSQNPSTCFGIAGVYYFKSNEIFQVIKNSVQTKNKENHITDAIQKFIDDGNYVYVFKNKTKFLDMGNISGLIKVSKILQNETISIGENSVIDSKSKINKFSHIGKNCVIENSKIGPYVSIGDNSVVKSGSKIKNSILVKGSIVSNRHEIINTLWKNEKNNVKQ
jgi:glucose-1-phosphate thymidylyltransferase